MRKSRPLDALFPRTRQTILATMLPRTERAWYLADLAKNIGVPPSSLQRELAALVAAGILVRRRDGNRLYYRPNPDCPFLPELRGLIAKTAGLVDVLREALEPLSDRIRWAFVYGSVARGDEDSASDVDVMVIGDVGLSEVAPILGRVRQRVSREVNPTVFSASEFTKRLRRGYSFPRGVLDSAKLFVVGSEHDLAAALERGADRADSPNQGGSR